MFAQDSDGTWLSEVSIRLGYTPRCDFSLTGFHRPPNHPACVVDYFRAISASDYFFQLEEMATLMNNPGEFFRGMRLDEDEDEDWMHDTELADEDED